MNRGSNADPIFQRELGRDYPTIDRGKGIHLYDTAGKRYIDGAGGVFVTNLGHGNQHVIEALVAQARRVSFAHTGTFTSQAAIDFAAKLLELAPKGFAKVWMSTSGSAANETAIKLARQYHLLTGNPEKTRVVARWNSYHGSTLGALSLTGQPRRREPFEPYLLDFPPSIRLIATAARSARIRRRATSIVPTSSRKSSARPARNTFRPSSSSRSPAGRLARWYLRTATSAGSARSAIATTCC